MNPQVNPPAPLGRRFMAFLIDAMVQIIGLNVLVVAWYFVDPGAADTYFNGQTGGLGLLFLLAYNSGFWGLTGTSPGKRALGLRLITISGRPPGLAAALGRTIVLVIASPLGITWWPVLWRKDRRALHDLASDTVLVRFRPQVSAGASCIRCGATKPPGVAWCMWCHARDEDSAASTEATSRRLRTAGTQQPAPESDWLAQLERLAVLRDQGAISGREYGREKARVLADRGASGAGAVQWSPPPEYGVWRQLTNPPAWARFIAGVCIAGALGAALALWALWQSDAATRSVSAPPTPVISRSGGATSPPTAAPTVTGSLRPPLPPSTAPQAAIPIAIVPNLVGDWLITDFVDRGSGMGQQFTFRASLSQVGAQVRGVGDINFTGNLSGDVLTANYVHASGSGTFSWRVNSNGNDLDGRFTAQSNAGTSSARRLAQASPAQVVSLFYTLVTDRKYVEAYNLLSTRRRSQQPFAPFRDGYATTMEVRLYQAAGSTAAGNEVHIDIEALDSLNGQCVWRRYTGTWVLIEEGGWKLDTGRIQVTP